MNNYLDAVANKFKSFFSSKIAFSSTIFNCSVSKKAAIKQNTRFYYSSIADYSYVGQYCLVKKTQIGMFTSVADYCQIGLSGHPIECVSTSPVFLQSKNVLKKNFSNFSFEETKQTIIGNDVWIGAGVMIKSGLNIGDGAIIGAGSVVTHDVPPYEIWAGNPARLIRKRFDDKTIEQLLKVKWWDWSEEELKKYATLFDDPSKLLGELNK